MSGHFLDFEQPIAELEAKIEELRIVNQGGEFDVSIEEAIGKLREKCSEQTKKVFSNLGAWQISQIARHPMRPYTQDYINNMLTDFDELAGDRAYADDKAIIGGMARLNGKPVMVIGQEKGRSVKDKVYRNFGMPKPEGYRKALRLMEMAERFHMPIITLIDTPGAYPGIDSEERGISEAIAQNLAVMSRLRTPIVCVVIGEGSSGGALGIGVGDHLAMLQYSTYFVISPEGCANIIWKSSEFAPQAAAAMGVTSSTLQDLGIVDASINEPMGGAHRDKKLMASRVRDHVAAQLEQLSTLSIDAMLEKRYARLMSFGN